MRLSEGLQQLLAGLFIAGWIAAILFVPLEWLREKMFLDMARLDVVMALMMLAGAAIIWIAPYKELNARLLIQQALGSILLISYAFLWSHSRIAQAITAACLLNLLAADLVVKLRHRQMRSMP